LKRIFLDTSHVVALVNRHDELHDRANELSAIYSSSLLLVTDAVLLEIGNSLARSYKPEAITIFDKFSISSDVEIVRLDEPLFNRALTLYKSYVDKHWGLVDCLSFVVMKENGVTEALTNDSNFVQAGFTALMREAVH